MATVATAGARSPMSSPRLPSPPPMAEDQTGPRSPLPTPQEAGRHTRPPPKDQAALRRIRPGTKAADMSEGPPLAEFSEVGQREGAEEHLELVNTVPSYRLTPPSSLRSISKPYITVTRTLLIWMSLNQSLVRPRRSLHQYPQASTAPCGFMNCADSWCRR